MPRSAQHFVVQIKNALSLEMEKSFYCLFYFLVQQVKFLFRTVIKFAARRQSSSRSDIPYSTFPRIKVSSRILPDNFINYPYTLISDIYGISTYVKVHPAHDVFQVCGFARNEGSLAVTMRHGRDIPAETFYSFLERSFPVAERDPVERDVGSHCRRWITRRISLYFVP